jgi:hypothetical protein
MTYRITQLAQTANYSCNAYGSGNYGTCRTTAGTGSSSSAADTLANTGYDILIPLALGVAIIIAGVIYFVKQVMRRH